MGGDNVDIFKKIIFSIPCLRYQLAGITVLSLVYSAISYVCFHLFAPMNVSVSMIIPAGIMIYFIPTLTAGELFFRLLPPYPRKWSYFLALTNQLILFLYVLVLSGANNAGNAWSIIWLCFITIYLANILVLVMSVSLDYIARILPLSLTQPILILGFFHAFIGRNLDISGFSYASGFGSLIAASLFLMLIILVTEYLIRSNTDVSAFNLTSGLLQNKREALDIGFKANPPLQTLAIDNGEEFRFAAPWIHPGPLGGFGGGKLSNRIISELNKEDKGFFFHVPCTHEEDLTDPEDSTKVIENMEDPEKTGEASELIKEEYDDVCFWGRRIGGKKIVYMKADNYDDYDVSIFDSIIDHDTNLLVDLHEHHIHRGPEKEVQYGTKQSDSLRESLEDFLNQLEDLPLHSYRSGFSVSEDGSYMALKEVVNGQEVVLMGTDSNGVTTDLRDLRDRYRSEFDEALLFSTDTHSSIHEMANREESRTEDMINCVERACESVSDASIGLSNTTVPDVNLLKDDYNALIFSINILIRLVILSLAVFYFFLILWIF